MGKGSGFEREIAKKLSLWWTEGENEDVFWRSQASGGRATMRKKKDKDALNSQAGDITAFDPIGEPLIKAWNIECKSGGGRKIKAADKRTFQNWSILDCIDSKQKQPTILKWWEQSCRDAETSNREPILIFRRNSKAPCIVLSTLEFTRIIQFLQCDPFVPRIKFVEYGEVVILIINLDIFLEKFIKPQGFFKDK